MIICIGPVCIPIWPLLFLVLKPIWNILPQEYKDSLTTFWDEKCYPRIEPYLDMLPDKVRKCLFYGMAVTPAARKKKEEEKLAAKKKKDDDVCDSTGDSAKDNPDSSDASDVSEKLEVALKQGELVYVQSEDEFDAIVAESEKIPVFFDFTAAWCKPCQALKPTYKSEAAAKRGIGLFCVVDIDDLDDIAMDHGVTAIPAIHCFMDGKIVEKMSGPSAETLQAWVNKMLDSKSS